MWYLPANITWNVGTAVAMDANTAHLILPRSPSQKRANCYLYGMKEKRPTTKPDKNLSTKKTSAQKKEETAYQPKKHSFFEDVWDVVRLIPKGRVTSYGAIAKYLGTGLSARMVGWAMNSASHPEKPIPAQRVLNRNGMLTGKAHFSPPEKMEMMLKKEGIEIENDTVVNLAKYFWDPAIELG